MTVSGSVPSVLYKYLRGSNTFSFGFYKSGINQAVVPVSSNRAAAEDDQVQQVIALQDSVMTGDDGLHYQDEGDIDCGGGWQPGALGKKLLDGDDCSSMLCIEPTGAVVRGLGTRAPRETIRVARLARSRQMAVLKIGRGAWWRRGLRSICGAEPGLSVEVS